MSKKKKRIGDGRRQLNFQFVDRHEHARCVELITEIRDNLKKQFRDTHGIIVQMGKPGLCLMALEHYAAHLRSQAKGK